MTTSPFADTITRLKTELIPALERAERKFAITDKDDPPPPLNLKIKLDEQREEALTQVLRAKNTLLVQLSDAGYDTLAERFHADWRTPPTVASVTEWLHSILGELEHIEHHHSAANVWRAQLAALLEKGQQEHFLDTLTAEQAELVNALVEMLSEETELPENALKEGEHPYADSIQTPEDTSGRPTLATTADEAGDGSAVVDTKHPASANISVGSKEVTVPVEESRNTSDPKAESHQDQAAVEHDETSEETTGVLLDLYDDPESEIIVKTCDDIIRYLQLALDREWMVRLREDACTRIGLELTDIPLRSIDQAQFRANHPRFMPPIDMARLFLAFEIDPSDVSRWLAETQGPSRALRRRDKLDIHWRHHAAVQEFLELVLEQRVKGDDDSAPTIGDDRDEDPARNDSDARDDKPEPAAEKHTEIATDPQIEEEETVAEHTGSELGIDSKTIATADENCADDVKEIGSDAGDASVDQLVNELDKQQQQASELIPKLLLDGRGNLAAHLSLAVEQVGLDDKQHIPSWLLQAIVLAPHVIREHGMMSVQLINRANQFSDRIFEQLNTDQRTSFRFLVLAAALQPSIITGRFEAIRLLDEIHLKNEVLDHPIGSLQDFIHKVRELKSKGIPLSILALRSVRDQAEWERDRTELLKERDNWREHAVEMNFFVPKIHRTWVRMVQEGVLNDIMQLVGKSDRKSLQQLREMIKEVGDDIPGAIREAEKQFSFPGKIIARAQHKMEKHIEFVLELAQNWVDLIEEGKLDPKDHRFQHADQLRTLVSQLGKPALAELDDIREKATDSILLLASVNVAKAAIENVLRLFEPNAPTPESVQVPRKLLNSALLAAPVRLLDEDFELLGKVDPEERLRWLIEMASHSEQTLEDVFSTQLQRNDHVATRLILDVLRERMDADELSTLERKRTTSLEMGRRKMHEEVRDLRGRIELALFAGAFSEEDRLDLINELDNLGVDQAEDLNSLQQMQEYLTERITEQIKVRQASLRKEISNSKLDDPVRKTILRYLDNEDTLFTAVSMWEMRRQQKTQAFEEIEDEPKVDTFFPERYDEIVDYLKQRKDRVAEVQLDELTAGEPSQDSKVLWEAWKELYVPGRVSGAINMVMRALGFGEVKLHEIQQKTQQGGYQEQWAQATFGKATLDCPIPYFGSNAVDTGYRIVVLSGRVSVPEILPKFDALVGEPTLMFVLGTLSSADRRLLASRSMQKKHRVLVLDSALILHLASSPNSSSLTRQRRMFRASVPFICDNPYHTAGGAVPPEMFVGRSEEIRQILDQRGAFVYGGRQLGKTILLRTVERNWHSPDKQRYIRMIDLKSQGNQLREQPSAIWNVLKDIVAQWGLFSGINVRGLTEKRFIDRLYEWFEDGQDSRRILLLLDEADDFLQRDARDNYEQVLKFKGLMEQTKYRFKVVFAGLHNVQRSSQDPNQPLAHLGDAICVGPMISPSEVLEARRLIKTPIESLGYVFENEAPIWTILSFTNYYPHLIQIFCWELLNHLQGRAQQRTGPPYLISNSDVNEFIFTNERVAREVRKRFDLTLDLDKRYKVIAYCIALEYYSQKSSESIAPGMGVDEIFEQVHIFWPEGFREQTTHEQLSFLLEEMVGLGVLRRPQPSRYAIRSSNLIRLLGTETELNRTLLDAQSFHPPVPYAAEYWRESDGEAELRSPLTDNQLKLILYGHNPLGNHRPRSGLVLVLGSYACQVERVPRFIELQAKNSVWYRRAKLLKPDVNLSQLKKMMSSRGRSGDHAVVTVVTSATAWSTEWIESLQQMGSSSDEATRRIVFVGDATHARLWMELTPDHRRSLLDAGLTLVTLTPWSRQAFDLWHQDSLPMIPIDHDQLYKRNAFWPVLIETYINQFGNDESGDPPEFCRWMQEYLSDPNGADEFLTKLGLGKEATITQPEGSVMLRRLLALKAEWEDDQSRGPENRSVGEAEMLSVADLATLTTDQVRSTQSDHEGLVRAALEYAELLGLAIRRPRGIIALNPDVRFALQVDAEHK